MAGPRPFVLLALLACASARLSAAGAPALAIEPAEWRFGMIRQGAVIRLEVTVANRGDGPVAVGFAPTCSCLSAEPERLTVPAGGSAAFTLRYDSADDTGITTRGFLVRTEPAGGKARYFLLKGTVRQYRDPGAAAAPGSAPNGTGAAAAPSATAPSTAAPGVTVSYYYTPGCRSCEEFLSEELPRAEKELGIDVAVERKDLLDSAVYEELADLAAARGAKVEAVPVLRVGDSLLQGDQAIRGGLRAALRTAAATARAAAASARASAAGPSAGTAAPAAESLAILPVILAGLIDGVNPCAFTTLIFLLASLALAGRGRREVLLIGALFSLSVFATYFMIGLGFFAALRAASAVSVVSLVLRWVLVAALLVFAGLSVYDYTLIRRGRPTEIVLQLPTALKRRIHASIRTRVRTASLAASSLALGFLVSIFEFACTGQVYLPTLGYLARVRRQAWAIGLLGLYNLSFILPLLAVFGASYAGVSSARITAAFQRRMGAVKLGLAVVFAGLAIFTLVG
jgi:cytochrome c biogenesis protein CcdA